jgi:hypothetical protein
MRKLYSELRLGGWSNLYIPNSRESNSFFNFIKTLKMKKKIKINLDKLHEQFVSDIYIYISEEENIII